MTKKANNLKIDVEDVSLEDMILLGEDKLIDIVIEYPSENGKTRVKAKIKQLTMKELKNIDVRNPDLETSIEILEKALFKQDNTPFERELILALPVGVVTAVSEKIMEVSGVTRQNDMGF